MDTLKEPTKVKARKEHKCDYCDKVIAIKEEYTVATYKDDYIYTWRTCDRCKPYVDEAFSNKDYDWSDGMGWQDFRDYMYEEHRDIAIEWCNQVSKTKSHLTDERKGKIMKHTCNSCEYRDSNTETCNFWDGVFPRDNICSEYTEVVLNTIRLDAYDIQRILKGQVLDVERNGNIITIGADLQDTRGMKLVCSDKQN